MQFTFISVIVLFILGFIFVSTNKTNDVVEGFNKNLGLERDCPNLLLKRGGDYYLYNSKKPQIDGLNPIKFKSLSEYKDFVEIMQKEGIHCPVLFLQRTYDTQGDMTYRMLDKPDQPTVGLPPKRMPQETKLYDAGHDPGSAPSFDPLNQYVGLYTPLDAMFVSKDEVSSNPMDTQWGGSRYTERAIESGKYAGSTVEDTTYNPYVTY